MANDKTPNSKFSHVYAIVRVDDYGELKVPPETSIMITKMLWSELEAENEVKRLNQLNGDKGSTYFYKIARLDKK